MGNDMKDWKLVDNQATRLRQSGEKVRETDRQAEKLTRQMVDLHRADRSPQTTDVSTPASRSPELPQAEHRPQVRTQADVRKQEGAVTKAAENFHRVAEAARSLRELGTKSDLKANSTDVHAVVDHTQTAGVKPAVDATLPARSVTPHTSAPTVTPPVVQRSPSPASPQVSRSTANDRQRVVDPDHAPLPADNEALPAKGAATVAAGGQAAVRTLGKEEAPTKRKESDEHEPRRADDVAGNHAATAGRTLRDLQGGLSADVGNGSSDADQDAAVVNPFAAHEKLPDMAPGFSVLNEFDPARLGAGEMKSKWQILDRLVLKEGVLRERLEEIARLDERLTLEIMPLAERVMTEHPELKDQLSTANFMKNVYGGSHC